MRNTSNLLFLLLSGILIAVSCSRVQPDPVDTTPVRYPVGVWVTSSDRTNLLYNKTLPFSQTEDNRFPTISVDTAQIFQPIDGFGYTLTGGSAALIHQLAPATRAQLLQELFGNDDNSLKISYLRVSIGASDLDPEVFSYNDLPAGQTDINLERFSLSKDTVHLIPVLKEILSIRPDLSIMGSPWSPPVWMKSNGNSAGGNLKPEYYGVYAQYFVRYIQAMKTHGIHIRAITPQNEPQHGGNNPSLVMSASQQAVFIKNHLGPVFKAEGLDTKIIIWDHNCDRPDFPLGVLGDSGAREYTDGTAFHLYAGDESALSAVHDAYPDKNLYFTEQWTGGNGNFGEDLMWHIRHVIIGTTRNWSRIALEWNLAADPDYNPHTPGGCTLCLGALTINGQTVSRNVSYYIIAHAARFVPPGSVRIGSTFLTEVPNVAFLTPDGKKVLVALNEGEQPQSFNISAGGRWITASLNPGSAGTFVWE
jgi:glucosylceramidase